MLFTRSLRYAAVVFPLGLCFGAPKIERPWAIMLTGAGERASAAAGTVRTLDPGAALFANEVITATQDSTIAFCPAGKRNGALLSISKDGKFEITGQNITARKGQSAFLGVIDVCLLPPVARDGQARNIPDLDAGPDEGASRENRLATVSGVLAEQYRASSALASDPRLAFLPKIVEAATLEQAALFRDARALYRELRESVKGATWTRDVISRLNEALLYEPPQGIARVVPSGSSKSEDEPPEFTRGQTFALLAGISKYPPGKGPDLNYAHLDAGSVWKFLRSARGGNVPQDNMRLLLNDEVTRDRFQLRLAELVKLGAAKPGTPAKDRVNTLIVFVAGHGTYSCSEQEADIRAGLRFKQVSHDSGVPPVDLKDDSSLPPLGCSTGQQPFIVMWGGEREAPNIAGFPIAELRELVTKHASVFGRVLLYLDVCHGGNATWQIDRKPPLERSALIENLKAEGGRLAILTGSEVRNEKERAKEFSYEYRELQHGVFTYYLLKGLNGAAQSVKGKVPVDVLSAYLTSSIKIFTQLTSPAVYYTMSETPVVDKAEISASEVELSAEEIKSLTISPDASARTLRGGFDDLGLRRALESGDLLGPGSPVASALQRISSRYGAASAEYKLAQTEYRLTLEDRGQELILQYLRGEQEPMTATDFYRCADLFEAALQLAPDAAFDESRALFCRGRAMLYDAHLIAESRFDDGRRLLERSIAIDPGRSYSYNALGISYLERANAFPAYLPIAMAAFRDAIRFENKWAYPRHNLALALTEAGRYSEAAQTYRAAMRIGPQYSYLPYNLGLLYQTIRNFADAKTAYREAIDVAETRCEVRHVPAGQACPERAMPLAGLASVYAQTGKRARSRDLYEQAHDDAEDDLLIQHNLASLYAGWKGHNAEAEEIWKKILYPNGPGSKTADHIPSLVGYTRLLKSQCRFNEAVPLLQRLTDAAPRYEPARLDLALALNRTNRVSDAESALAAVSAHSVDYWAVRAEVLAKRADEAGAEHAWRQALAQSGEPEVRSRIRRWKNAKACPF